MSSPLHRCYLSSPACSSTAVVTVVAWALSALSALICLGSAVPLARHLPLPLDRRRVGSPAKLTRSTDAKRKGTCLLAWSRAANNNAPLSPCRRRGAGSGDRCVPARAAERCDLPCPAAGGTVDSWSWSTDAGVARLFPCTSMRCAPCAAGRCRC